MTPPAPSTPHQLNRSFDDRRAADSYLNGTGSPLLLLHGIYMSWTAWRPVFSALEPHHTVFAPTLAGHRGGPVLPDGSAGIAPFADALERQLDELGWGAVHVAGNSLGGWLALELAQRGRARSVVALSPAGSWVSERDYLRLVAQMRLLGITARTPGAARLLRRRLVRFWVMRTVADAPARITDADVAELLRDARECAALDVLLEWMREHGPLQPFDLRHVPVRIVWPYADRTISWGRYGRAFRRLTPGAEFTRLEGVGHVPMYDDPRLVAETILSVSSAR